MICIRCRASVIGDPLGHLQFTRLCPKCYRIYLTEQPSEDEKIKIEQKEIRTEQDKKAEEERITEAERIDNRFDILDM